MKQFFVVAGLLAFGGQQPGQEFIGQCPPHRSGEVCHILGHIGVPGKIVPGQLIRAEGLLPQRRDSRTPAGQIEVGKMAGWVSHSASVRARS